MKTKILLKFAAALLLIQVLTGLNAFAQGTAFTYQGQLQYSNSPANGTFDFTFKLWNNPTAGTQEGSTLTFTGIAVSNGLFTVTNDFGAVYNGNIYYLELGVRTNGGATFDTVLPRQELTPAPYAITAENVDGQVSASQLTGTVPSGVLGGTYGNAITLNNAGNVIGGNGAGLTALNGSQITTGTISDARLSSDVAYTDSNQTFTLTNVFASGIGGGRLIVSNGFAGAVDTNAFTGLSFQYDSEFGEGALMSSYNNEGISGEAYLSFYTKETDEPVRKQVIIDQYGGVAIDQQGANAGFINDSSTNGVGLTFGVNSGEGIASKRTTGSNQYSLDFYTASTNRMIITQPGQVGINTTNPAAQLHVIKGTGTGSTDAYNGGPVIIADTESGDAIYANTSDGGGYGLFANSDFGNAVYASTSSGTAVGGNASSGTALYGNSTTGSALTIGGGAIHVTGASTNSSTAAFIQVANASNISGAVTFINNPICNGDPNAILIVTPNYNINSGYWNHPLGVYYETIGPNAGKWSIVNEDGASFTAGPGFNVLIIKN